MSRFARPEPLAERWLERRAAPSAEHAEALAGRLAERLEWWRARERSFVAHAPFDIEEPGPALRRPERGLAELWFPIERIRREAHALLGAHFDLDDFDAGWRDDLLARASSWLDARRALASLPALPSVFLGSLADPDRAEASAFECHDPASYGHALDRYPEVVRALGARSPGRVWDAGCGTGETSFALARVAPDVVGTTPSPWELLMARRRGRPHDRGRTLRLRAATEGLAGVSFELGDLRRGPPPGSFDAVFVGGVLGGALSGADEILPALSSIARALAPGGTAYMVDRFRADRHMRARALIEGLAPRLGLRVHAGSWMELRWPDRGGQGDVRF